MATRVRADAQKFTHDNYTAATSPATKALPAGCTGVLIDNMDAAISLLVSFDGGTTYKTIKAGNHLSVDCDGLLNYLSKSASSTVSTECLYTSEA